MAVNLFNRAQGRGIGIRGFVSVGNEADIDVADSSMRWPTTHTPG